MSEGLIILGATSKIAQEVGRVAARHGREVLLVARSMERADHDIDYTLRELNTNFTSAVSLLSHAAEQFEGRKKGVLAVITSVAGDRARRSNYVYGTAKGALTLFAQGLRARLFTSGVRVLTIKPGPVDTPMTAHMKTVDDVPEYLKDQIKHFFEHYKALEKGKWVKVEGWKGVEAAHKEITDGVANFKK